MEGAIKKKKKIKIKDFKSAKLSMTHEEIKHNAAQLLNKTDIRILQSLIICNVLH